MTKIAVTGYFGWGNFGDELFLDTVLRRREELWPGSSTVISMTKKHLALHARTGALGALFRALHTLRIARSADVLAYCGGSVFGEVSGVDTLRRRLRPARVEALGVSLGPFASPEAERAVIGYLAEFNRIIVRDGSWTLLDAKESVGLEAELNSPTALDPWPDVELGGDLAALSPLIEQVPTSARDGLVVCPSAASGGDTDILARQVLQAHQELQTRGRSARVRLLALNGHPQRGDAELVRDLADSLRSLGVESETSSFLELGLEGSIAALSSAELVLAQRLHGAIVAYLSGGNFLMINHHPKCSAFVKDATGSLSTCVPLDEVELSAALDASLNRVAPLRLEPREYVERAHRVYLKHLADA